MRFLKASAYYSDFIQYASRKMDVTGLSYEKQLEYFFSFSFAWSDFWKRHLEKEKNIPVTEIVFNIESAQKKWAEEQGVSYSSQNWQNDILEAQISFYKPDIIFFEDYLKPPSEYKKKFPFIKYIISWDGIAYMEPARFAGADVIATCHEGTFDFYKSRNINCHHFVFGFETSVLEKIEKRPPQYDVSFVGSVSLQKNGHTQRLKLLDKLNGAIQVNYWISTTYTPWLSVQMAKYIAKGKLPDILKLNRILRQNRGKAFGNDMYQILSDSKITLNSHIDAAGAYAANIRLFESTGTGVCLLTDWKKNLNKIWEIDKEVVAYKSEGELVEKTKWLLEHEDERKKIAAAGQKRTLEHYSLRKRILDFFETIKF